MDAFAIFVRWLFAAFPRYIVDDASFVEAPTEIPDDADKISNDVLHKMYGCHGMSKNIRLFIQNGHIYVYYESLNGVRVWQSVEIPHGWNVKEEFKLMRYCWYNPTDSEFPQNLHILVFLDGGFLKLTFSFKCARHEVKDDNFVRLVDISVYPYSRISGECFTQKTMEQYVGNDGTIFFVSSWERNNEFLMQFDEIFFDEKKFDRCVWDVVVLLREKVGLEYKSITLSQQFIFFDLCGKPTRPNFHCSLEATNSCESVLIDLCLDPQSVKQYFDGTEGLGVYRQKTTDQKFVSVDCVKSSESELVGSISFLYQDEQPDATKLSAFFSVAMKQKD